MSKLLALIVMYSVEGRDDVVLGDCVLAVIVPAGKDNRTFWVAGGAFWWGFQNDGSSHPSNVLPWKYGLKTSLFKYGRFLIPTTSYGWGVVDVSRPKPIKIGTLPESH